MSATVAASCRVLAAVEYLQADSDSSQTSSEYATFTCRFFFLLIHTTAHSNSSSDMYALDFGIRHWCSRGDSPVKFQPAVNAATNVAVNAQAQLVAHIAAGGKVPPELAALVGQHQLARHRPHLQQRAAVAALMQVPYNIHILYAFGISCATF